MVTPRRSNTEDRLREELSEYCRVAYQQRLATGTGGNLSVRVPGTDQVLITPSAVSLRECGPAEFITVDLAGQKLAGAEHFIPSKEVHLHTAVYAARPDVQAIAHLHPPHCIIFACLNRSIPLVTITAEVRLGPTPVVPEAPSGSQRLANLVRDCVLEHRDARLILLERHGVLAIGDNIRDAVDVADLAEDTARVAHQLGLSTARRQRRVWDVSVRNRPGMHSYPGDPTLAMTQVSAIARGDAANVTHLSMGAHTGTHVDAPAHFLDGAGTLDRIALDRMVGPAQVVDLRGRRPVDADALAGAELRRGGIVLLRTDNSELWAREGFQRDFTYLTRDAAELLIEHEIKTIGFDYLSIEQFGSKTFEVHKILLRKEVLIIEGLDLRGVAPGDYELVCLPLNFEGVDGAPARAVLMQ